MKTTIVPAQITSVEDKIAGNLSFKQLLLMIIPVFIGAGIFAFLPPFTAFKIYKLVIASVITIVCLLLSIRIKGLLIADWLVIRGRYNLRPQLYVFQKNDMSGRKIRKTDIGTESVGVNVKQTKPAKPRYAFQPSEILAFDTAINHPRADFHLQRSKKGGLHVRIKKA